MTSCASARQFVGDVRLTRSARFDLSEIREYSIEQFRAEVADVYFLGFDDALDLLARHPFAGPETPRYGPGVRCLVHRKHRIFYRAAPGGVVVLRVIHHARDAYGLLKS